ncbi:hypothetical protein BJY01DRAFT_108882 [Aspergillus pseudoustus]|uniref:Zn(2)-C6 fungal-type domain-containing protein n=1 Tax=Aspergillus pseudoustus TaxID=1810923 RepID=A0ABR4IWN8_9EURO
MSEQRGPRAAGEENASERHTRRHRGRTQKACDMCHEMKTKCDGAAPCAHCKNSFLDCLYSESRPKRRRNSPQPRKEHRRRPRVVADEGTNRSDLAATISKDHEVAPTRPSNVVVRKARNFNSPATDCMHKSRSTSGEAWVDSSSADRAFIDRLRKELGEWPGSDIEKRLAILDRPTPRFFSCKHGPRPVFPLPSLQRARQLVNIALDAHVLYRVIDRDRFERTFQLLFLLEEGNYGEEETRHLPLVYALLALGVIYEKQSDCSRDTTDERLAGALGYFDACRDLIDVEDSSVLTTLQALFYMNMFRLATASLVDCYTSLVHVQTLVLRMTLHPPRSKNDDGDDAVDAELKARIFWSIRQLLVFVSTSTGLPSPITVANFQMDLPVKLGDTNPSRQAESRTHVAPNARLSDAPGFVHYIKLYDILDLVIQKLYPSTAVKTAQGSPSRSHSVSIETVTELENQLERWSDNLPESCRRGQDVACLERANYELLMTYCHVQMYLHRQFLHYLTEPTVNKPSGPREAFQKYAFTCIEASRNIIYMGEDMRRNGLLFGAEWRIAHMILNAALSLLYAPLSDRSSALAGFVMADLAIAKSLLSALRPYCVRAQRAHLVLTVLTAAFSGPCEEALPTTDEHGTWDSRHPLPDGPDAAYTATLRRRLFQAPLLHHSATNMRRPPLQTARNGAPTRLAQDGHPLQSSADNELYPLSEMSQFHPGEDILHPPTGIIPSQAEIQITTPPPLQSPAAAIADNPAFNPAETAFNNDPTAHYYFETRPSSIFQDIVFDDDPFYQLLGDGAAGGGMDGTSDGFARFGGFF